MDSRSSGIKGWAGEELEIEHRREQLRNNEFKSHKTVDLGQFQNKEVGVGYQARGVIRQRGADGPQIKIIDMTKKVDDRETGSVESSSKKKRKREKKSKRDSKKKAKDDPLKVFLECKALRNFRKEIEKVYQESRKMTK
ncbi:hypothetical protein CTEN210_14023 [Chaetoceros tenuissimus]|uniref:Uncharacterized protein n=1 Tax=Chaetoceros tenuissimus TaxID=426638 RepID=A0AAD3D4W9_9STRA|nr:hypothetical protein CTEN210_14023 [Chaetoceros tenuissimus]